MVVRTGEFGSSAAPTVNVPIEKVQTGGFGDPNGVKGEGKPNARWPLPVRVHLTCRKAGARVMARAAPRVSRERSQARVSATALPKPGQGDGRSNGSGHSVQTGGFSTRVVAQGRGQGSATGDGSTHHSSGDHLQA